MEGFDQQQMVLTSFHLQLEEEEYLKDEWNEEPETEIGDEYGELDWEKDVCMEDEQQISKFLFVRNWRFILKLEDHADFTQFNLIFDQKYSGFYM